MIFFPLRLVFLSEIDIFPQPPGWVSLRETSNLASWIDRHTYRYISRDAKFHAAPIKSARGSGTSHPNRQILIERNRLGATKSEGASSGIDFEKS